MRNGLGFFFVDATVLHCGLTALVMQLGDAHFQACFRFLLLIQNNMLFLIVLSNAAAPLLTLCLNAVSSESTTTAVLRVLFRATIL